MSNRPDRLGPIPPPTPRKINHESPPCHVLGCLFTLEKTIPFDAIDNEPVDLLFVLLVPEEATSEHLELLSQIAEKFNNPALCTRLRNSNTPDELYQTMID